MFCHLTYLVGLQQFMMALANSPRSCCRKLTGTWFAVAQGKLIGDSLRSAEKMQVNSRCSMIQRPEKKGLHK